MENGRRFGGRDLAPRLPAEEITHAGIIAAAQDLADESIANQIADAIDAIPAGWISRRSLQLAKNWGTAWANTFIQRRVDSGEWIRKDFPVWDANRRRFYAIPHYAKAGTPASV